MRIIIPLLSSVLLLFGVFTSVFAAQQKSLELPSDTEVRAEVYGQSSKTRVLWIGPSYGVQDRHQQVAADLGKQGLQVWQTDLAEAMFLPRGAEAMRDIPPGMVAELIQAVSEQGKYPVLIVSGSYGAIPALRGVHAWQATQPTRRDVVGVVLFSPALFTQVPNLGEEPQLVDVVAATSVPVYIFQSEKNANRWHLPAMVKQLQLHAPVYTEIMSGVTSMFYKEDTAEATMQRLKTIAARIKQIMPLLAQQQYSLQAIPLPETKPATNRLGLDDRLKPYRGRIQPTAFTLTDVNGRTYSETDFKGKVSVINFWATWCPPCVEEIPSLNRLRQKMQGKPLQLISINYGESAERIRAFMQKVAVDFPVLVDPDGKTAGAWKVVAFPSTFVIGPDGQIRYGVNAAIHWDTDEVIGQLEALLK